MASAPVATGRDFVLCVLCSLKIKDEYNFNHQYHEDIIRLKEEKKYAIDKNEPVLINKIRDLLILSNIYLNHAPRHEKYSLCREIRDKSYEIHNYVIEGHKKFQKKGINFVGYRTWRSKRFIRKKVLQNFRIAIRKCRIESINALLEHSLRTSSFDYLILTLVKYKYLYNQVNNRYKIGASSL